MMLKRFLIAVLLFACAPALADKPNFILIFTDDQGYNDLGCFGSETIKTPHIDQMAKEGRRFTSFYIPANICTPSRSALMTGCYPKRISMERGVIFPKDNHGLHPEEVTIAEVLKSAGYATACIGKWHLGHRKSFLPTSQGFDSYYGIPYSNDMTHPGEKGKGNTRVWSSDDQAWQAWKTPLMQDDEIIELPVNQQTITHRYTSKAIEFVTANRDKPFFLYLAHTMPHVPLFVPKETFNPDKDKAYVTVIEHIDTEVGRLMKAVRDLGLSKNTYVIYTSDNGPWLSFGPLGGCAKPLRAGKFSTYEGGHRVPCVMWGPGRIPANTSTEAIASTLDLFPSFAKLAGAEMKSRGVIDGKDITAVIHGSDDSPRNELLYYSGRGGLEGLRQGDWKIRIAGKKKKQNSAKPELYNLKDDIGESNNLAEKMPEKVEAMRKRMRELDAEIEKNKRSHGTSENDVK